jgi:hypothetical protein
MKMKLMGAGKTSLVEMPDVVSPETNQLLSCYLDFSQSNFGGHNPL